MADSTVFESALDGSGDGAAKRKPRPAPSHPKIIDMVVAAIKDNNDNPRKGTSVLAIKKWIEEHYPEIVKARQKVYLKNALTKGLALGLIERPKTQDAAAAVLVGRYKLGKPPKPAPKPGRKGDSTKKRAKKAVKGEGTGGAHRSRSTSPKNVKKSKPVPRARARSVSATPRVSKSKKIRSRLSKSHSPLRTPKVIKPKVKTSVAASKKAATSPAATKTAKAKKSAAAKPAKKSPAGKAAAKGSTTAKKTVKKAKTAKTVVKANTKDAGKKKK